MQIKRNNDIPLSMADALVALIRRYVLALDPEATPHDAGIVRALVPVLAGAGGISMYVGAAINDACIPVGLLMGYNAMAPLDGEIQAHAPLLMVDAAGEGVTATTATELVADFEAWAKERQATQLRVELAPTCGMPLLAGFRPSTTAYSKKIG
jgi:hypothetical protein